jgi:hypothetical protein
MIKVTGLPKQNGSRNRRLVQTCWELSLVLILTDTKYVERFGQPGRRAIIASASCYSLSFLLPFGYTTEKLRGLAHFFLGGPKAQA